MNILFFLTPKQDVRTLMYGYTVRQAIEKQKHSGFTALPVIDEQGLYRGSLTEGDLLYALTGDNKQGDWEQIHIADIIKPERLPAVRVDAQIDDLLQSVMTQNFVPVIDDRDCLIGIVKRSTIIGYLLGERVQKSTDA